jgi:hypothetical protein
VPIADIGSFKKRSFKAVIHFGPELRSRSLGPEVAAVRPAVYPSTKSKVAKSNVNRPLGEISNVQR